MYTILNGIKEYEKCGQPRGPPKFCGYALLSLYKHHWTAEWMPKTPKFQNMDTPPYYTLRLDKTPSQVQRANSLPNNAPIIRRSELFSC